ncbi:aldose 1-epimerase [Georgenia sp. EYE_87]|uniref:aldose 1-epimerase n=1 Tax=Georgenia sp. EYE_87 TaxID=2853448 RepID=UPI002002B8F7|nr:aldose 1-epimerase [Georgenia sp. EYE_87]MCK6209469.1 aldose 1-epimerase [Georgenia sp. EYE_87]
METTTRAGIERGTFDGESTWVLNHPDGARLVVAETGATVLSWQAPRDGELVELLDGYASAAELAEQDGYRNAVLVPWSNRLRGGRYSFGGAEHTVATDRNGEALHGLLTAARFSRAQVSVRDSDLAVRLVASVAPEQYPGYPFSLDVAVSYALGVGSEGESRLGVEVTVTNTGETPAPVALGWHPYLRLPGHATIDDLEVVVPARSRVLTDDAKLPLAGDAALAGVASPVQLPLARTSLDHAFTDLVPDDDGVVATVLRSPRTGESLTVEQDPFEARVVHLFTGDALHRDPRASLAVEPCGFMADAFNRADVAEALVLAPGAQRQLVSDIVYRRS